MIRVKQSHSNTTNGVISLLSSKSIRLIALATILVFLDLWETQTPWFDSQFGVQAQFRFQQGGHGGGQKGQQQRRQYEQNAKKQPKEKSEDYYKLLGVKRDATDAQIKKAFKKMAIKYHPDKNQDDPDKAKAHFQKLANAYETLGDPDKRRTYDVSGEEGVREQEQRGGGGGGHHNMDDMFSQFFGGGGGGGGHHFNFGHGGGHGQQRQEQYEDIFANSDVI